MVDQLLKSCDCCWASFSLATFRELPEVEPEKIDPLLWGNAHNPQGPLPAGLEHRYCDCGNQLCLDTNGLEELNLSPEPTEPGTMDDPNVEATAPLTREDDPLRYLSPGVRLVLLQSLTEELSAPDGTDLSSEALCDLVYPAAFRSLASGRRRLVESTIAGLAESLRQAPVGEVVARLELLA